MMAAMVAVVTRDVISKVANDHGYKCWNQNSFQLLDILSLERMSCVTADWSWQVDCLQTVSVRSP